MTFKGLLQLKLFYDSMNVPLELMASMHRLVCNAVMVWKVPVSKEALLINCISA